MSAIAVPLRFDRPGEKEKLLDGSITQHISVLLPERYHKVSSGRPLTVYFGDEYLYPAQMDEIFRLRFYRRITPLPYIVGLNRYMSKAELQEFATRSGYKNHAGLYLFLAKFYGKTLSRDTFLIVRFARDAGEGV